MFAEVDVLGAFVPAGAHRVRFHYESRSAVWGWVSVAALIAAAIACAAELALKRRFNRATTA